MVSCTERQRGKTTEGAGLRAAPESVSCVLLQYYCTAKTGEVRKTFSTEIALPILSWLTELKTLTP